MDLKEVRQRCQGRLRDLALPEPFSVDALCKTLAAQRGRPLYVLPIPEQFRNPWTSGAWVPMPEADYVFYEPDTSMFHRWLIILHELSHIIWGHLTAEPVQPEGGPRSAAEVGAASGDRICRRTRHEEPQEQEAEAMARLILGLTGPAVAAPPAASPADAATEDVLERLAYLLGARQSRC